MRDQLIANLAPLLLLLSLVAGAIALILTCIPGVGS